MAKRKTSTPTPFPLLPWYDISKGGGCIKTVIYLDVLLLTNFVLGALFLLAAGLVSGQRCSGGRALCGAAVAAASSLALLVPTAPWSVGLLYKGGTGALAVAAAYGWPGWRAFVRLLAWFWLLNLMLTGAVLLPGGRMEVNNLSVYLPLSPEVLLVSAGCVYGGLTLALRLRGGAGTLCGRGSPAAACLTYLFKRNVFRERHPAPAGAGGAARPLRYSGGALPAACRPGAGAALDGSGTAADTAWPVCRLLRYAAPAPGLDAAGGVGCDGGIMMLQILKLLFDRLWAALACPGGVHYVSGAQSLPPPLTPEEEKQLLARMMAGDAAARDELITHNLRLVVYLAKKYESSGVPQEDMISIGTIGLIKAVNTFTPERNIKLATYASRCIGNEILMYLRKSSNRRQEASIDEPLNIDGDGNELLLSDVLGSDENQVGLRLEQDAERATLRRSVERLNPRERQIMELRFGLVDGVERTQKEAADAIGISQSYISRLEKRIIRDLRKQLEET